MDTTQWSGGCLDHSKDSNSSPEGERKGEADRDREGRRREKWGNISYYYHYCIHLELVIVL